MSESEFTLRPTQSRLISRFTQGERDEPFPSEFLALDGTFDQQRLEEEYEMGAFDPDVFAVLRGDYQDIETQGHPKEPRFRYACPMAFGLTCSQGYMAAVEAIQGDIPAAAQSAGMALIFLGTAEHLDYLSGRYYSEMLAYVGKHHCPPLYSPAAMEEMSEESFRAGVRVGASAQEAIASIFSNDTSVPDKALSYEDPEEALMAYGGPVGLAMRVARIVLTAEKETLTPQQISTLRHARTLIQETNFDPNTLCQDGIDIYGRMNEILDQNDQSEGDQSA